MRKKLGEILIAAGAVSREDIDRVLHDQSAGEPGRLGDLLVSLGKITPLQLAQALCTQYGLQLTEIPPVASSVLEAVPLDFQRQHRFVPIDVSGGTLTIAIADPSAVQREVVPVLKRRWQAVKILVAAGDEVDAVHAALGGELPGSGVRLPAVAPIIAPVKSRPSPSPTAEELFGSLGLETPAPALVEEEEEPFFFEAKLSPTPTQAPGSTSPPVGRASSASGLAVAALSSSPSDLAVEVSDFELTEAPLDSGEPIDVDPIDLGALEGPTELPPVDLPPMQLTALAPSSGPPVQDESFELTDDDQPTVPPDAAGAALDPFGFELPDAMPEFDANAPAPITDVPWDAAAAVAAEPVAPDALAQTAAFLDAQLGIEDTQPLDAAAAFELEPLPAAAFEAEPVLEPSPGDEPVPTPDIGDHPFFDGAPGGDPIVPMADEAFVPGVPASSPSSLATLELPPEAPALPTVPPVPTAPAPAEEALPSWLSEGHQAPGPEAPVEAAWTGALDAVSPSKLIVAMTRALIKRGLVTEAEILEEVGPRK